MSRPVRAAASKKKYAEESESEDFDPEEDDSFDEEEDPDEIPVPGGGNTIRDAVQESASVGPSNSFGGGHSAAGSSRRKQAFPSSSNNVPFAAPSAAAGGAGPSQPLMFHNLVNFQDPSGGNFKYNDFLNQLLQQSGIGMPLPYSTSHNAGNPYQAMQMQNPYANIFQGMGGGGQLQPQHPYSIAQRTGIKNESPGQMLPPVQKTEEAEDQEDEAMGVAETYSDYTPAKLNFGKRHPDSVVETASMASVDLPDIKYKLKLPKEVIDKGHLSNLQLEAVVYACQHHEFFLPTKERAGFLIGDGAGVGKGRTIAGIIYENYCMGRKKAIWVSVSTDLKYDSDRDLKDIGANIDVVALNKLKYGKITQPSGIIFSTYSSLIGESSQSGKFNTRMKQLLHWCGPDFDGCIVFDECHRAKNLCAQGSSKPTKTGQAVFELQKRLPRSRVVYASATGASEPRNMAYMTRLGIWGPDTPFPEFMDFVRSVEKRGVGAMEIVAMDMKRRGAYIARQLSFHGVAFNIEEVPLTPDFIKMYDSSVELWVELLHKFNEAAQLMKIDNLQKKSMWGQFWSSHQRFFKYLCIAAKVPRVVSLAHEARKLDKCVVIGLQSTGEAKTMEQLEKDDGELSDFVSTAKGVLQSLVEKHFPAESSKVAKILEQLKVREKPSIWEELEIIDDTPAPSSSKRKSSRKAAQKNSAIKRVRLDSDDSDVIISDDSEYEASKSDGSSESYMSETSESEGFAPSDEEIEDEDGTGYGKRKKEKKVKKHAVHKSRENMPADKPSPEVVRSVKEMRKQLLEKIEVLGSKLPFNALDQLIEELGGPEDVAEMTGRKGRVIQAPDGSISYQSRSEAEVSLETINLTEKQRFMDGEKNFAIISEAASSGISLQSDRRAKNTRKRVHITLELPWSADRAIQQFGRTHRSNQIHPPEYVFLISELAGEQRFASIVAKRLESLGALTHGDRRAGESRDLSKFHIDTKYGREALEISLKSLTGQSSPLVPQPSEFSSMNEFFTEVLGGLTGVGLLMSDNGAITLDKECTNMSKFLNRILGMPVKLQNSLFQYFMDTLNFVIANAKNTGRFDMGILDLGDSGSGSLRPLGLHTFYKKHSTGLGKIELHKLLVERGMSWESAIEMYSRSCNHDADGFYLLKQVKNDKRVAVLVVSEGKPGLSIKGASDPDKRLYTLYRPSTGMQLRRETWKELKSKYDKKEPEEVKSSWMNQYEASARICTHAYWNGRCRTTDAGLVCDIGTRNREYNVLSGSVLMVWTDVESALNKRSASYKMLVVRVRDEDLKLVGVLIPNTCVDIVIKELKEKTEECKVETFKTVKKEALDN